MAESKKAPMTFVQKVLAKKAGLDYVEVGQIVTIKPDHLLTHDNTSAIVGKISKQLDEYGVADPNMPVIVLDHVVPACSQANAAGHKAVRQFVMKHNIKNFYDVGNGVCHQVVVEKGHAMPGSVIVGSDSHTCSYGAVGCYGVGIDRTEAASLLLTGELWLRVPPTIKVTLKGKFSPGVSAKDLVLHVCGQLTASGAAYSNIEYHGDADALECISVDERFTITNMGVEMDSKGSVFPCDKVTLEYLRSIGVDVSNLTAEWADDSAQYAKELEVNLAEVVPMIAKPHTVDNVVPVTEVEGTPIDQFFLGTCTNGRHSDFKIAAGILKDRKVNEKSRMIVCPASKTEYLKVVEDGTLKDLIDAGAMPLPTGCGPCLGAHQGALAPKETCLSTANRNFKGRMGCPEAFIYLASPATVAASAITGVITDPRKFLR